MTTMSEETQNPLLSIVIPTFNRSELLRRLLGQLDEEDYLPFPFEVIVVDNASSDPAYEAIRALRLRNYAYRYYRHGRNIGAARNIFGSYRLARGQFSMHLCDDDYLLPAAVADTQDRRQFADALEIMHHIDAVTDVSLTTPNLRRNLVLLSNLDLVIKTTRDFPGERGLILVGFGPKILDIFKEHIETDGISLKMRSLIAIRGSDPENSVYLAPTDAVRQSIIQMTDATPGSVFSIQSLNQAFDLEYRGGAGS